MKKVLQKTSLALLLMSSAFINGQTIDYKKEASKENSNFFEIVNKSREQFLNKKNKSKTENTRKDSKARKQFERWVWIWKDRVNSDGSFPKNAVNKEEYIDLLVSNTNKKASSNKYAKGAPAASPTWEQIGPTALVDQNGYTAFPGVGRVNAVAVVPANTNVMYAGTVAGGVWKTTNGGSSWFPKSDSFAGLGVSALLIDPTNANIVYVATGDEDGVHISSIGIFKSTDAGETWSATGLTFSLSENEYIRDLSFAPGSSTTIFALTNHDIKKSVDSGLNWSNVITTPAYNDENFQNIVFDPNDATKVVVSDVWGGLWYSSDSGVNFSEHAVLQGASANKLKLTTSANDTDNFYGITQDGKFKKFRFENDNSVADLVSEVTITGFNSQGGYNQCIAVSPTDKNSIIIAGVNGYKSTDNGATFSIYLNAYNQPAGVGFYVHPDHHYLSFLADGVTVINGHDGGIHKGLITATAASGGWTDISQGLIITQPYNIAITHGLNGDDYMMANQDNDGFSKVLKDGVQKWVACVAGDGTATAIDIANPNIRYLGGTYGTLYRTADGYSSSYDSSITILSQDQNNAAFVSPLALHPTVATTIYAGHGDVKKSTDRGDNFTALNSSLNQTEFLDVSRYNNNTRILAIGLVNGVSTLRMSLDDGATWVTIAAPEVGLTINSAFGKENSPNIYITVKGYTAGKKVYKSVENGSSWFNISGSLPNIIMKKIMVDPNKTNETIYLGTELGLYSTINNTSNWAKLGTGLPNVIISDIKVSKENGNVYVGTFGRGMWVYNVEKSFHNVTNNNWSETTNWEGKSVPTSTDNVFIAYGESVIVDGNGAEAKGLEIVTGGLLTINKSSDLTLEDKFNSESSETRMVINADANDSGVLNVKSTGSTGILKYVRGGLLANKWSLFSSPVLDVTLQDFKQNNSDLLSFTDMMSRVTKLAVGKYNDANAAGSKWEYYTDIQNLSTELLGSGIGYAMAVSQDGSLSFTGKVLGGGVDVPAAYNKWVLIGNPFTAYYPINRGQVDFIKENTAKLDVQAAYLWDTTQNKYVPYADLVSSTQKVLAPGQGFFIKTKTTGTAETVTFDNNKAGTKGALTGDHTFDKSSNSTPYIKMHIAKGNIKVSTDIIFSEKATIGFDTGKDIINFNQSKFDLTTKLLDNLTDKEYAIQSIPKDNYENQVVSLNLKGAESDEVTFSVTTNNLPEGMKVFLEDKETSSSYELNETKNYKLTLSKDVNGFGRFYLRFSAKVLSLDKSNLTGIKIFNYNNFLQIEGINSGSLKIDLFDMNGKKVFNKNLSVDGLNPVDLNSFSKGVYLVKVTSKDKTVTQKIIIN